jgi:DNA mismatch repair protein MLH1
MKPQLSSIENLLRMVKDSSHSGLIAMFKNYSFVGCVNENLALIQHQTELFLCNVPVLRFPIFFFSFVCDQIVLVFSKEFIYQECLHKFGEFTQIKFSTAAPIHTLCMLALDCPGSGSSSVASS